MTVAEYARSLQDAGWTADEADRVARCRFANRTEPGTVRLKAQAGNELELLVYDFIGFDFWSGGGITPQWLVDQLKAAGRVDRITVRVNSPGGDVFDAMTIYNILRRQECPVAVEVEGLAASAASYVIQAASPGELKVAESAMLMIHRAWGMSAGNANELRQLADVLEKLDGQIAGIYAARTGTPAEEWLAAMDSETWYTGAEAVDCKLADATLPGLKAAACIDPAALAAYRNTPAGWLAAQQEREQADRQREAETVRVRLRALELAEAI